MRDDLPSGTVTFLFTDVEGSTLLLRALGAEAYAEALAEHRRLIREACVAYGGVEVDTQGDAFFFAFPTAPGALAAATAFTDTLAAGPIRVRVGLHTGTPLLTGEGYVGDDVHRAARIGAAGHGGQVLVSASTTALVRRELADLGEHRFKDLSAPERVYQLGVTDFPPLKTLYQTNLPIPPTPFLGREHELAEVLDLLTRDEIRLLTLTGPGGTGKTRLAAHAAGALAERYPHGIWWIPLAALRDPEIVLESAAQTLGVKGGLASHIAEKRLLLLFDNFEHVLEAAAGLAPLLAECPHVKLLVTSREPLHLSGEHEYAVPPFVLEEAVGFFAAKARALEPGFQTDEAVPEICRRLDSLPLALELAAARVKALSSRQILERLEQRLPLLTSRTRDTPERQRTLRATIEWSYDLLSPDEQQLFGRLSVFAGGCTLEAAEEVCDADVELLQSLVEKSLLRFADERYWMLETIREYAGGRAGAASGDDAVRDTHAAYFARLADGRWGEAVSGDTAWRETIRVERDNLQAALEWSLERGQGEVALAIVSGVFPSWFDVRRTRQWAERALALPSERATPRRAASCLALGESLQRTGDLSTAKEVFGEAIAVYRQLEDALGVSVALVQLGDIALDENEFDEARRLAEESASIRRELGGTRLARPLLTLGNIALAQGDLAGAAQSFEEAEARLRAEAPESVNLPFAIEGIGDVHLRRGNARSALDFFREALDVLWRREDPAFVGPLEGVASAWAALGRAGPAARLAGAAERVREQSRFRSAVPGRALPERVEPAWSEGRGLTADDAVDYALRSID